jgi:1,4-dihydroxy-2-naphthoyl-CoA hydrolase
MIWKTAITLNDLNNRSLNTAASHLGIVFSEIGDDFLVATMPVNNHTMQPLGLLHGGISVALAETVGSSAANYCIDQEKYYCVGLDINANHMRSAKTGIVTAVAKPLHLGRSTQVWEIKIVNDNQMLVCISRLTMAVITKK